MNRIFDILTLALLRGAGATMAFWGVMMMCDERAADGGTAGTLLRLVQGLFGLMIIAGGVLLMFHKVKAGKQ